MDYISLENLLKEIIDEKVNNREAFTAFDITMISKKRGNNERHRNIKETIHDIILRDHSDYNRQLITIPGAPTQPFLYFPDGYNIDDYIPMERDELSNFTVVGVKKDVTEDDYGSIYDENDENEIFGEVGYDDYDDYDDEYNGYNDYDDDDYSPYGPVLW